jgi:leucyl-tRNA synthetase
MEKYNPQEIERKWQKYWEEHPELYITQDDFDKEKQYILDMFPYPSGEGLHVGHVESYTATDIISRFLRMNGKNVLHPQGWDAFGLPAENYAIKTKIHPAETTKKSIATFKGQMSKMGFSYDWSREVNSSDPEYYKWTQWFFLQLYENGWAYKKLAKANWCPSCQTVLANEQVVSGKCERCGTEVVQKDLEQWFFKITDFIEDNKKTTGLITGLNKIDWPDSTKAAQKNWIGRSEGAQFKMPIAGSDLFIEVYTTRLDTAFGITYAVVAPEHPIVAELKEKISNWKEVEKYLEDAKKKTDLERMEAKEKTGVELQGVKVINPFNNEKVPLYVADYVLSHYGTGAVMAVPAHDERDWEFARKYNLPIKEVIVPSDKKIIGSGALIETPEGKFIFQKRDHNTDRNPGKIAPFGGGVDKGESFEACLKRELKEEINLDLDFAKVFSIGKIESH